MKEISLTALNNDFGQDVWAASVWKLWAEASTWDQAQRSQLSQMVGQTSRSKKAATDPELRLSLAKVLVVLLPDSYSVLGDLLGSRAYDFHFLVFCMLDEHPAITSDRELRDGVASLADSYLQTVRVDTAHAAGMAGELLGENWPVVDEAVARLIRLVSEARFVAGRMGALDGLLAAMHRSSKSTQQDIVNAVRTAADTDRSRRVRNVARYYLSRTRTLAAPLEAQ